MKNKKTIKLRNVLTKSLIYFAIVFSMYVIIYIAIGALKGTTNFGGLWHWLVIFGISILTSIAFYFFFKLNSIRILTQIIVTYCVFSLGAYILGFILKIFSFNDLNFFFIAVAISIVGLLILSIILSIKQHYENDKLNKELNKIKERDNK